jgi:hypothetical protein
MAHGLITSNKKKGKAGLPPGSNQTFNRIIYFTFSTAPLGYRDGSILVIVGNEASDALTPIQPGIVPSASPPQRIATALGG